MRRPLLNLDVYSKKVRFFRVKHEVVRPLSVSHAKRDMARALEVILPHPTRVWRGEQVPEWDNAITKRNITIFGAQETGKSHTARFIASKVLEYYDKPVYAIRHPDNLLGLLDSLSPDHEVQVIFGEDLTSALKMIKIREQQTIAKDWFRIRHKMKEKTGKPYGLIIAILGLHRFHGAPPAFTTENDLMIFKSVPTNPYDFNVINRFIGDEGIRFLQMVEQERVHNVYWMGYGVWWHRGEIGVWYNPRAEKDPFILLETPKEAIEKVKVPVTKWNFNFDLIYNKGIDEDPEIRPFLNLLPKHLLNLNADPRDVEWFTSWINGESQRDIALDYGTYQSVVSDAIERIEKGPLGKAGELAYKELHPELLHKGGESELDFFNPETDTVISLKTKKDVKWTPASEDKCPLSREEQQLCLQGKRTIIIKFECTRKPRKKIWLVTPTTRNQPLDDASHQTPTQPQNRKPEKRVGVTGGVG